MNTDPDRPGPIPTDQRIVVLDMIRGFALFGVLLMNMIDVAGETVARPESPSTLTPILLGLFDFFVSRRFLGLFSLLFGVGLVIQIRRAKEKGIPFTGTYLRRLVVLFLFGVAHSLLYPGDILKTYATVGILLPLAYGRAPRTLLTLAVICTLASAVGPSMMNALRGDSSERPIATRIETSEFCQQAREPFSSQRDAYDNGTFVQVARVNACRMPSEYRFRWLARWIPAQVLGLFLIGVVLGSTGFFRQIRERLAFIRKMTVVCGGIGFGALGLQLAVPGAEAWWVGPTSRSLLLLGYVLTTLAYCGALMWLYQTAAGARSLQPFAAVGRMALTVYLGQTVIQSIIFYGFGLGFEARGAGTVLGLAIVIFLAEIIACNVWLRYFRYGPTEWLWRSITYVKLQPLRVGN